MLNYTKSTHRPCDRTVSTVEKITQTILSESKRDRETGREKEKERDRIYSV